MAEFDPTGFVPVDAFFTGDDPTETIQPSHSVLNQTKSTYPTKRQSGRRGVGSTNAPVARTGSNSLVQRLSRVGAKRRHDDDIMQGESVTKDDEDDSLGRTSIIPEKITRQDYWQPNKKLASPKDVALSEQSMVSVKICGHDLDDNRTKNENHESTILSGSSSNEKKRKRRRKVRSRQKNIRKDTRPVQERPKHLILGAKFYEGLPITPETRHKLGLEPAQKKNSSWGSSKNPIPSGENRSGAMLAVDDLLNEPIKGNRIMNKKKAKQKYKNLIF